MKRIFTGILNKFLPISKWIANLKRLSYGINDIKILNAKILSDIHLNHSKEIIDDIQKAEFKVFSQWGDDGIINFLVEYLKIEPKTFIEFGVENYQEANTRFLLINNNWRGLIIDSSFDNIKYIKKDDVYWKHNLTALCSFVTCENINSLITNEGFTGEIGLLHIDIDGNDYWIWKEIECVSPVIVIIEYNSIFGSDNYWTIPYKADFFRTEHHYSNLYFGASIPALCRLAEEKGYHFIGCNSNGNNAYFIRKDKIADLKPLTSKEGYVLSTWRESRDKNGALTFLSGGNRLKEIKGMEILNTLTDQIEKIS